MYKIVTHGAGMKVSMDQDDWVFIAYDTRTYTAIVDSTIRGQSSAVLFAVKESRRVALVRASFGGCLEPMGRGGCTGMRALDMVRRQLQRDFVTV